MTMLINNNIKYNYWKALWEKFSHDTFSFLLFLISNRWKFRWCEECYSKWQSWLFHKVLGRTYR